MSSMLVLARESYRKSEKQMVHSAQVLAMEVIQMLSNVGPATV